MATRKIKRSLRKNKKQKQKKSKRTFKRRINRNTTKKIKRGGDKKQEERIWTENINGLLSAKKNDLDTYTFKKLNDNDTPLTYTVIPSVVIDVNTNKKMKDNKKYWVDENDFIIRTKKSVLEPTTAFDKPQFTFAQRQTMTLDRLGSPVIDPTRILNSRSQFWNVTEVNIGKTFIYNNYFYTLEAIANKKDILSNHASIINRTTKKEYPSENLQRVADKIPIWRDNNGFRIFIGWNPSEAEDVSLTPRLRGNNKLAKNVSDLPDSKIYNNDAIEQYYYDDNDDDISDSLRI